MFGLPRHRSLDICWVGCTQIKHRHQEGNMGSQSIAKILTSVLDAFNAHDLDRIMSYFSDDCVLDMPRGPDPWGSRHVGFAAVREGLASRFAGLPDVQYVDDSHFVSGNMGISQWTI